MPLPTKSDILKRAKRIELEDIVGKGLPAITPEEYELKESGAFQKARRQLMSGPKSDMEKYLRDMAGEMKLKLVSKKDLAALRRETGYVHINGWTKHKKREPKPKPQPKKQVPKPKILRIKPKPKKRHVQRNGKTMRRLRKRVKDGQKVFSFPDHIWKVRK